MQNQGLEGLSLHILEQEQERAVDKIQEYYERIEYAKRNLTKKEVKRLEGYQKLWETYYHQIKLTINPDDILF